MIVKSGKRFVMQKIDFKKLNVSAYELFAKKWFALAAGNEADGYNAMTIAWGQFGSLWERTSHSNRLPVVTVYVRQSRYTKAFMDKEELFTLSLLPDDQKKALGYLGSHTGRDEDKIKAAGLTPFFIDGTTAIASAEMIFVCRKLYQAPIVPEGFVDKELVPFNYPEGDFHEMYVGEVLHAYQKGQDAK